MQTIDFNSVINYRVVSKKYQNYPLFHINFLLDTIYSMNALNLI